MEVLQSAFWSLDPARTVAKFEAFASAKGAKAEEFVALEDWANDGPPLAAAAARELFEDFFAADLPGRGEWRIAGSAADPGALPFLNIVSTVDRSSPAKAPRPPASGSISRSATSAWWSGAGRPKRCGSRSRRGFPERHPDARRAATLSR
jgi:polyhydroxyalkanoate synthase